MSTLSAAESQQVEDEYAQHRRDLIAFIKASFPSRTQEAEEIYHDAWAELLEFRARGGDVYDTRKLLRVIAWRRARDRVRDSHTVPVSPTADVFDQDAGLAPTAEEEAQIHLDAATARQIVASLEPRHAAVIKLRFEAQLAGGEIQAALGVSRKRYEKIVTEAYHRVDALLAKPDDRESAYRRRQRSLLLACLIGAASSGQLERAREMVAQDVGCRAMLRQLRHTLDRVAILTPVPIVVDRRPSPFVGMFDRLVVGFERVKQALESLVPRGGARIPAEQAAGGAATLSAGAAAKVALTCLAVGATAICIDGAHHHATAIRATTVVPHHRSASLPTTIRHHLAPVAPAPRRVHNVVTVTATPVAHHHASHLTHHFTRPAQTEPRSAAAPPQPLPAPVGSSEFDPGGAGSQAAAAKPASALSGGGGEFLP